MKTISGVKLKTPEISDERLAQVRHARAEIFAALKGTVCKSEKTGFILTRISEGPESPTLVGGTLEDCEVVECVRKAISEALVEVESVWERGQTLGVQLNETGRLGPHDPTATLPVQNEYCGTKLSGRLPAQVIRQIVRSNFGALRECYEDGLSRDPHLGGEIAVRFVIERNGEVGSTSAVKYTIPDCAVGACVLKAFESLVFPEPDGGIVTVTYPIRFSPD